MAEPLFHRKILVTGMPRSGTRYIRAVLQNCGLNVGHETMRLDGSRHADGLVSCFYAWDDYWYPGHPPYRSRFTFDQVWHQLRDPREVLPSLLAALRGRRGLFWRWQERHTGIPGDGEPGLIRAAKVWIVWTRHVEATCPDRTYRLEDVPEVWPELAERLGIPGTPLPEVSIEKYHNKDSAPVSWEEIEALDRKVSDELRQVAASVGYE